MKRNSTRWLMLVGLLSASAFMQATAGRVEPQLSDVAHEGQFMRTTQNLMSWLYLDSRGQREVNFYSQLIALGGTGVLGAWFLMGGIPKRNRGLSIVAPATSERVKVIEGPTLEGRSNPIFLQAFPAKARPDNTWLGGIEAGSGMEHEVERGRDLTVEAARGFVQEWIVAGDRGLTGESTSLASQEKSAEMMDSPIDHALLAEVEQYARQLLGRSPGLDVSSFDQMMAAAMAAVDAARSPVDKDELILSDHAALAEEIAGINVPGWVDQDEAILCELWGITPEEAASVEDDVLGIEEFAHTPMRITDEALLELETSEAVSGANMPSRNVVHKTVSTPVPDVTAPLYEQRIIILGESEAVLEIEKRIVIAAGARVITFRRWDEALAFADEKDFDLLLINGITADGWSVGKLYDWMAKNRPGWERRSAFGLSAPDAEADEFATRTAAWCIVHPFGPKELVSFMQAVLAPRDEQMVI
jgi:hypothetical protein